MATLPILRNHDWGKEPVGYIEFDHAGVIVTLSDHFDITKEMFFRALGNCGGRVLEMRGEFVKRVQILEFSV